MRWFRTQSISGWRQPSQRNTAIGTPHTRWREMHQSGRVAIMLAMRSSPHAGSHFTLFLISSERAGGTSSAHRPGFCMGGRC